MKTCSATDCKQSLPATSENFYANRRAPDGLDCYCKPCRLEVARRNNPITNARYFSSPAYTAWAAMKQRCFNPNVAGWHRYGGRGITVCKRWMKFENFLADMGERPDWATGGLDRIDPDGNYEPGNCRWSTIKQQANNKSKIKTPKS